MVSPRPLTLLIVVLHPLIGTAVLEEVLVRGLLLKLLLTKMGGTQKGIVNACLIASLIFGLAHIVNLTHMGVASVIPQIMYATAIGLFFAALYLRTKRLWVPILLHGLFNLATQIFDAITLPSAIQSQSDTNLIGAIIGACVVAFPFLLAGGILLRKVEPDGY